MDSADVAFIYLLAFSCPYVEGNAVYIARNLWGAVFETPLFFDDQERCAAQSNFKREETIEPIVFPPTLPEVQVDESKEQLLVSPNPGNNEVVITRVGELLKDAIFGLFDLQGQLILKFTIFGQEQSTLVNILKLESGFYIVKGIKNSDGRAKLSVLH